ncbi:N-acetyltransferase [Cryobacterium sp.]|jgi:GNAT superfamily N-acetyltransferase|uniref:GNAT family N-acetyltransferase n=1 Tax=Cryobacterium sp. TaxID=1926290 RepID=UPI002608DA1C|nr:GNAT family N-acetyltransferase [Cryobacterium sp.]MCU1444858.1 family N-acetyltransferase [Cryobacterium sp.]
MALFLALLTLGDDTLGEDTADALTRVHLAARAAYYGSAAATPATARQSTQQHDYRRMWRARLTEPGWRLTGAFSDGSLRGFSAAQVPPGDPDAPGQPVHLAALYVDPGHWGIGIGSLLYDAFETAWRSTATPAATLEVWSQNHRARVFYARRGWELDGRVRPAHAGTDYLGMVLRAHAPDGP